MGRHLNRNHSALQFEKYYRGCIWGLLPLHFQSFKKLMPHIKHKHDRPSKPGPKTKSNESHESREFELGNSDSSFTATDNDARENISILASKKGSRSKRKVPQRPRLQKTYSIHHLETPSNDIDDLTVDHKHPVVIQKISDGSRDADNILSQPRMCTNVDVLDDEQVVCNSKHFGGQGLLDQAAVDEYHHCSGHSESYSETYEDFFDCFQIDKKLFMKSKYNSDADNSAQSRGELKSHRRATFSRSGSFPMANKSCSRYGSLMPSKLESKLTEVWPSSPSSSSSFHSIDINLPRSCSCKQPVDIFGEVATEKSSQYRIDPEDDDYATDVRRYKLSRMRRASSLNESLERYTQLFETSFRRNAKLNFSKSLRLSNEREVGFNPFDFVLSRKVHSMREALWVEWRSNSIIEFPKVPTNSVTLSIENEHSDSEVNKDESCAGFEQQFSCSYSFEPRLSGELQIKADSDPYSDAPKQLGAEDVKSATGNCDQFLQDGALGSEDRVNIAETFETGNSFHMSTEINNDLEEQLLSDIVNEALLDVCERYDAYWPTPLCFSSNCHMHPLQNTEYHVTRQVQTRIQKLQCFSVKTSHSADSVVSYDLANGDGWMKLQADAESIGLALDEMIFDELIEELM